MGNAERDVWGGAEEKGESRRSEGEALCGEGGRGIGVEVGGCGGGHIGHHERIWVTPVYQQPRGINNQTTGWENLHSDVCTGEVKDTMEDGDMSGDWQTTSPRAETAHGTPLAESILTMISDAVVCDNYQVIVDMVQFNPQLKDDILKISICKALQENSFKILSSLIEICDSDETDTRISFSDVFRLCADWKDVKALIRFGMRHQGALQWLRDPCGRNALQVALKHGDVDLCLDIVEREPGILGLLSSCGLTALHMALLSRRQDCVDMFLSAGADPNGKTRDGLTPILLAVINNNFEGFKSLIKAGADINCKDRCGTTPLHHAVANGHLEYVKILIENGALEAHGLMQSVRISTFHLSITKGHVDIMKLLLENGCSPTSIDYAEGWGAIHFASAECQNPECLDTILNHPETDINLRTQDGRTALMLSVSYGQCELVRRLLKHPGCGVNIADSKSGMTALHRATDAGCHQCTNLLIQNGSILDYTDLDGATPLLLAVNSRHTHLIVDLLLWGRGRWPWQPLSRADAAVLQMAAKRSYWDIVLALVLIGWNTESIHKLYKRKEALSKTLTIPKRLEEALTEPYSLKQICRLQLKVFTGAKTTVYIHKLNLPSSIRNYVLFEDLRGRSFWCS